MEYTIDFKCVLNTDEEIPQRVIEEVGVSFPKVHCCGEDMARLASAIREQNEDLLAIMPFCLTVEAEALGADIKMGDDKVGPRVSNYAFKDIEDLKNIKPIDLNSKRISEVLKAVEILSKKGEKVALVVQGPFTIMSSLMDPRVFYKAVRKEKDTVEKFMQIVIDSIVSFIEVGVKKGAKVISFGDSSGTLDILGPKMYKDYSGRYSYEVLKRACQKLEGSIIHLCGITSNSMEKGGFITSEAVEIGEGITYGEALKLVMEDRKDIKIIGHNCLKKASTKMRKPIIWKINL